MDAKNGPCNQEKLMNILTVIALPQLAEIAKTIIAFETAFLDGLSSNIIGSLLLIVGLLMVALIRKKGK
jgi:hypothetical protein